MCKLKKVFFIILFFAIYFAFLPFGTNAIEYNFLGGKPANPDPDIPNNSSWFIYNLDKGQSREDRILVINNFDEELNVLVYAADGVKSSSGGFALKQLVEEREAVGSWVKFYPNPVPEVFQGLFVENNSSILAFCSLGVVENKELFDEWCKGVELVELTLDAKDKIEIDFVFSVPEDAEVGEHTGGILIQKAEIERDLSEQQGIAITTRVGVRIYQTVPGDIIKKIDLKNFSVVKNFKELDYSNLYKKEKKPETMTVTTEIENLGNVSVDFTEVITIRDELLDRKTTEVRDRGFQVLRDDTFVSNYAWHNPRFGKFSFVSNVSYLDENGDSHNMTSDLITIWIVPWREFLLAFIAVTVIFAPIISSKVIRRRKCKNWVVYTVRSGETFDSIVNRLDVKWKTFAKLNNLKPPYALKTGQRILMPPKVCRR